MLFRHEYHLTNQQILVRLLLGQLELQVVEEGVQQVLLYLALEVEGVQQLELPFQASGVVEELQDLALVVEEVVLPERQKCSQRKLLASVVQVVELQDLSSYPGLVFVACYPWQMLVEVVPCYQTTEMQVAWQILQLEHLRYHCHLYQKRLPTSHLLLSSDVKWVQMV